MNRHPQLADLDLYALGALEVEEKQPLEDHLTACADCQQRLAEARGVTALLALGAEAKTPRPQVREQLLRQIRKLEGPRWRDVGGELPVWKPWPVRLLALATLLVVFIAGYLAVGNRQLSHRVQELERALEQQVAEAERARAVLQVLTAPETLQVTLVVGTARPLPQGKVFYHAERGLLFYAANLPALPPEKAYQLWLVPIEGDPISAGVFAVDAKGDGSVVLPPLPPGVAAKAFAVTVEPAGGLPKPSGPMVLVGAVS